MATLAPSACVSPLFEHPPTQIIFSGGLLALIAEPPSSWFPCGGFSSLEAAEDPSPSGWSIARDAFSLEFWKEVYSGLLEMEGPWLIHASLMGVSFHRR